MNRAHNVGGVGLNGVLISTANYRLCGHVKDNIRTAISHHGRKSGEIADVRTNRSHRAGNLRLFEKVRLGRRGERVAGHVSPECVKPQGEPASFETGMPRDEHIAALPKRMINHAGSEVARGASQKL